jgi:hypothetical protein
MSLSRLDREIADLHGEQSPRFALAHHLYATYAAYDQALAEACVLAGIGELPDAAPFRRVLAEAELRARGWHW